MRLEGERVKIDQWFHTDRFAVRVEVEAVVPIDDPSEPCLEPDVLRFLDQVQDWVDAGAIEQLEKIGTVYERAKQSA